MIFLIIALMCFGTVGYLIAGGAGLLMGVGLALAVILGMLLLVYSFVKVMAKEGFRIDG